MSSTLFTISTLQDLRNSDRLISPEYQRPIDKDRVNVIRDYILINYNKPEFYMPDVVLNKVDDVYRIIDGHHRIYAIIKITGSAREKMKTFEIRVIVKDNLSETQERKLFVSINMSVPCPKIYLSDGKERKMLTMLRRYINSKYGQQVSDSKRCVIPNINVSNILDTISRKNIDGTSAIGDWFSDQTIVKPKDLCDGLESFNEYIKSLLLAEDGFKFYKRNCSKRSDKHDIEKFKKLLATVVKKSGCSPGCYLGFIGIEKIATCMFSHGKLY